MEKLNITKEVVVQSPKDEMLKAVVIEANKTCWKEIISEDKIGKFDEPDKLLVQIKFETSFDGSTIKGEDVFAYYEKPMSNSKMGKYLEKYEKIEVGQEIKVLYNKDGFGKVHLE